MDETPPAATPVEPCPIPARRDRRADAPSPDGFSRADLVAAGTVLGVCCIGFLLITLLPLLATPALIPTLLRARQQARLAACQSNLHAIGRAMQLYMNDYNGQAPPDLETLVKGQYVMGRALKCPSADTARDCDYFYYCRGRSWELPRPDETIVACDFAGNHRRGRSVLYADGHIRWWREAEFAAEVYKPQNVAFAVQLKMAGDSVTPPMPDVPD